MNKHHHNDFSHVEEGKLTVKSSGRIEIKLDFVPDFVDVEFEGHDQHHGCCDISVPDSLEAFFENKKTFDIEWTIKSTRTIKWVAKKRRF